MEIELLLVAAGEERRTGQQLVGDRGQVVDERALVDDLARDLLGCDRIDRTEGRATARLADGEAHDLDARMGREDHVGAEVAMDDADLLRGQERLADRVHGLAHLGPAELARVGQRLAHDRLGDLVDATLTKLAAVDDLGQLRRIDGLELAKLAERSLADQRRRKACVGVDGDVNVLAARVFGRVGRRTRTCANLGTDGVAVEGGSGGQLGRGCAHDRNPKIRRLRPASSATRLRVGSASNQPQAPARSLA